ncbi:sulfite exporter TauE/SafE family protein [Sinisalibacter lacisalsi]|uniref:Probable membrane transporter protein n=1 Tax=Sinisalibacter lacisalsi TaxID=1526570 RepID=A0ABQ1QJ61_9RHOB|nr:sulfite exporter TauE/SafE family protein [Sinisalibacter lacisalsi]GGD27668.1 UPF0721 transmembrane protein [Sinisalibacter lacisalsi]
MPETLDMQTLVVMAAALVLAGALIGVLAGLFGVGGGAISVPVFYEVFRLTSVPEGVAMPLAVGTSLAIIIPTSIVSARAHARRGTVDFALLRSWIFPVLVGVVAGSVIARFAPSELFQIVFVAVASINAVKMLVGGNWRLRDSLPGRAATALSGAVIGLLSALMGIGGGAISNLFLTLHGRSMREAVSTSAGVGVLIAIPGAIGYMAAGWGKPGLPFDAIGYVSVLTLLVTLPTTLLTTRFGAGLAHAIPKELLTRLFGLFLLLVSIRFVFALI